MRVKPLILIPIVAVALAACSTQATPKPESTQAASEKPLFATDEEALAAAQAAYANYLEVSDQIARDGGANPERLKGLVSDQLFQESKSVFENYSSKSLEVLGSTSFDSLHVSEITNQTASYYVCLDVSGTHILSADGVDQTPTNRPARVPILFVLQNSGDLLTIESSEVWSGRNFC